MASNSCQRCGAHRYAMDAAFCSNCGERLFDDVDQPRRRRSLPERLLIWAALILIGPPAALVALLWLYGILLALGGHGH
jgi:predicted amidophosphoribosyltransferase